MKGAWIFVENHKKFQVKTKFHKLLLKMQALQKKILFWPIVLKYEDKDLGAAQDQEVYMQKRQLYHRHL